MQYLALYAAVLIVLWVLYVRRQRRIQREHAQQLKFSVEAGLDEPPSLHPVIDPRRCLGSCELLREGVSRASAQRRRRQGRAGQRCRVHRVVKRPYVQYAKENAKQTEQWMIDVAVSEL